MRNSYEQVKQFHAVFGHPIGDEPAEPEDDRQTLRLSLIKIGRAHV